MSQLSEEEHGKIQQVVMHNLWPTQEVTLRKMTDGWSVEHFLYALECLRSHVDADRRAEMTPIYRTLLDRAEARAAKLAAEQVASERNSAVVNRLDELKKPHWSVWANLGIAFISAVAAILAAYFAWVAVRKP